MISKDSGSDLTINLKDMTIFRDMKPEEQQELITKLSDLLKAHKIDARITTTSEIVCDIGKKELKCSVIVRAKPIKFPNLLGMVTQRREKRFFCLFF